MTLITINAVVHISADARVPEVGRDPAPMALGALEDRIVRGIRVADRAHAIGGVAAMSPGEKRMTERRAGPSRRCVAGRTGCWEPGCRVSRIRCAVVIRRVATDASDRQCRVVIVHVAAGTGNRCGVKTSQRESRCVVIKYRARPRRSRVTQRAVGRECRRDMIRYRAAERCGALVCRRMAIDAGC